MTGYISLFLGLFIIDYLKISNNNKLNLAFILIALFSGFRYGIGYDYFSYYTLIQSNNTKMELIPMKLIDMAHHIHFSLFFLFSSIWIASFFTAGMKKMKCGIESIYFFVCYPPLFCSSWGLIRQAMAYSVIFYLMCHQDYRITRKIILVFIAFLCHRSSLIAVILLFPIEKLTQKSLWMLFVGGILGGEMLVKQVITMNMDIPLFERFQFYVLTEMNGGSFIRILVYGLTIITLLNYKKLCRYQLHRFVAYTCIGGTLYAVFSLNPHMAERFCTFFFSATLVFIPLIRKFFRVPKPVFILFLVFLFGSYVYVGHINSTKESQWTRYKKSLFYPYQTIFEQ